MMSNEQKSVHLITVERFHQLWVWMFGKQLYQFYRPSKEKIGIFIYAQFLIRFDINHLYFQLNYYKFLNLKEDFIFF